MTATARLAEPRQVLLRWAQARDRDAIYRLRHEVYAAELGQHPTNADGRLSDALDAHNWYVVAELDGALAGFVSITPPSAGLYSIDKHFPRAQAPFAYDHGLFEVRLLTVAAPFRGTHLGHVLMMAALRAVDDAGGTHVAGMGRAALMDAYRDAGLVGTGATVASGAVTFELMHADVPSLRHLAAGFQAEHAALLAGVAWPPPRPHPPRAVHGGRLYDLVGPGFERMEGLPEVVPADVLDAWFDPAPAVLEAVRAHLAWAIKASPPMHAEGLTAAIAQARRVPAASVLAVGGSSALIHLGLRAWTGPRSRILMLDPTYSEYAHVLQLVGADVDRLPLSAEEGFRIDEKELAERLARGYDWVILVNPNNPTGQAFPKASLLRAIAAAPPRTRFWVDETYVDFAAGSQSLEREAAASRNVLVCKSMSKAYALSGARVAYACGPAALLDQLRPMVPPWSVGTVAQVAACAALKETAYYEARWRDTRTLGAGMAAQLAALGVQVFPSVGNFLLCRLPETGPTASELVRAAWRHGVLLRSTAGMGATLGQRFVRIAVRDGPDNAKLVQAVARALQA